MCNPQWRSEALEDAALPPSSDGHKCNDISCRPCRLLRIRFPPLARLFWEEAKRDRNGGGILPPCSWCGYPTEHICDFCPMDDIPAMQICSGCDRLLGLCKNCYTERDWIRTGYKQLCAGCGKRPSSRSINRCEGCHIVRYCNRECQVQDWSFHKKFCRYLQHCSLQPPLLFHPPFSTRARSGELVSESSTGNQSGSARQGAIP